MVLWLSFMELRQSWIHLSTQGYSGARRGNHFHLPSESAVAIRIILWMEVKHNPLLTLSSYHKAVQSHGFQVSKETVRYTISQFTLTNKADLRIVEMVVEETGYCSTPEVYRPQYSEI